MAEFEEQWPTIEVPPSLPRDSDLAYYDAQFGTYFDFAYDTIVHKGGIDQETPQARRSDTAVDNLSETFAFFDLENAALDPGGLHQEAQVFSTTESATLCSPMPGQSTLEAGQSYSPQNAGAETQTSLWQQQTRDMPDIEPGAYPAAASVSGRYTDEIIQLSKSGKRTLQEDISGAYYFTSSPASIPAKKRKKRTQEQLDSVKKVRAHRPCLRCYVQKDQCSEGRPCETCQSLFAKNTRTLQWTTCVSASLPKLNIFALGISLLEDKESTANGRRSRQKLDLSTALPLYKLLFGIGLFSDAIIDIDKLYFKVLQHTYGYRAFEVHPFIVEDHNPLYLLIQLNVILLGGPVIAPDLIGRVRYLQKLRAICAVVAFECLGRALHRTTLAESGPNRQSALIVQVALLLEQVVEMRDDLPAAEISCARGETYKEMRQHLIQYLSYYLQRLVSRMFSGSSPIFDRIQEVMSGGHLGQVFWDALSDLMPSLPLRKPTMLRRYADMSWNSCGVAAGQELHEHFALKCSIGCD